MYNCKDDSINAHNMEFKAKKISVPNDNPFKFDKLDRKAEIDNLSILLRNFSSPIVISVNSPWGTGKTTFLEMLNADLLTHGCKSIFFSAWETDFASDPLLAFIGEMNQAFKSIYLDDESDKGVAWDKAKKAGVHILKKGIPALVKIGTAGIIDAERIIEDETAKLMEGFSKDLIDTYTQNKSAIAIFKENIAKVLENTEDSPTKLYIFIDELDRCRPTYAIELLERIKHLLDIEGLVFVLALDKQQLAHSVRAVYGQDFDALGYLRRFIDIEYSLRAPTDLNKFIDNLFETFGFQTFFASRTDYQAFRGDAGELRNTFKFLTIYNKFSLREIEQLIAKVNIVILSTPKDVYIYPALLAFLLVAKEYHADIYQRYIKEINTPEEIIALLYSMISDNERLKSKECALIEGYLIASKNDGYEANYGNALEIHKEIISNTDIPEKAKRYSHDVGSTVVEAVKGGSLVSLKSIIERIDMLGQFNL